jgi:hypothetical protein
LRFHATCGNPSHVPAPETSVASKLPSLLAAVLPIAVRGAARAEEASAGGAFQTSYGAESRFEQWTSVETASAARFVPPPAPGPAAAPAQRRAVRVVLPNPYMNDR